MVSLIQRHNTDPSYSGTGSSRRSDESHISPSTAPTSLYESSYPSFQHAVTTQTRKVYVAHDHDVPPATNPYQSSSALTYASTVPSVEDIFEEPEEYDDNQYAVPEYRRVCPEAEVRASSSYDFAELFPSQRTLYIRHDDTTDDGNMNLRVETEVMDGRHRFHMQLFHLRMHELKAREFSLRRYCRDSGREVCHSARRYQKPASERPGIQRSVSSAFANLRGKPDVKRSNSQTSFKPGLIRHDSGYGSSNDEDDVASFMGSEKSSKSTSTPVPTKTIKLEFSNYAQVDVKRRGAKGNNRYEFEYWGSNYAWKRDTKRDSTGKSVSYYLVRNNSSRPLAHIVPEIRSPSKVRAEKQAGCWVPPCSMWISDERILAASDIAEVIVATGLIALVDDCIELYFNPKPKPRRQISLPGTPLKMEYVGPKGLVEMLHRRSSDDRENYMHGSSPLRRAVPAF